MNLNLIASFGDPLADFDSKAFPTPDKIAASSDKVLREAVRVGYRAPRYMNSLFVLHPAN